MAIGSGAVCGIGLDGMRGDRIGRGVWDRVGRDAWDRIGRDVWDRVGRDAWR